MVGASRLPLSYIAAGVKSDYEKLMTRYAQENSVRYEVFAAIWKELRMNNIFCLRQTDAECREFTEECMKLAQKFLLSSYEFQTRVCALYILYALYHRQICTPPVQIRVCPWQWQHMLLLLHEARETKHLDVEYVLQSMLVGHAFTFTATHDVMYPEKAQRPASGTDFGATEQEVHLPEKSILSEILQPENIDQLSAIHEQYHMMKCMLQGPTSSQPHESLNVIKPNLVQQLTKLVANHQEKRKVLAGRVSKRMRRDSGQTTTSESEADSDSDVPMSPKRLRHSERSQSTGARRAAIKAKAYSQVKVTHRRRKGDSSWEASFSSPGPSAVSPQFPQSGDEIAIGVLHEITSLPNLRDSMLSMPSLSPERPEPSKNKGKKNKARKVADINKEKKVADTPGEAKKAARKTPKRKEKPGSGSSSTENPSRKSVKEKAKFPRVRMGPPESTARKRKRNARKESKEKPTPEKATPKKNGKSRAKKSEKEKKSEMNETENEGKQELEKEEKSKSDILKQEGQSEAQPAEPDRSSESISAGSPSEQVNVESEGNLSPKTETKSKRTKRKEQFHPVKVKK